MLQSLRYELIDSRSTLRGSKWCCPNSDLRFQIIFFVALIIVNPLDPRCHPSLLLLGYLSIVISFFLFSFLMFVRIFEGILDGIYWTWYGVIEFDFGLNLKILCDSFERKVLKFLGFFEILIKKKCFYWSLLFCFLIIVFLFVLFNLELDCV